MSEHIRIKDLPREEKPREKMLHDGPGSLSDAELLAIFLRTGTKGKSAIEIGKNLLKKYGSLSELGSVDLKRLRSEHGLGLAKSCQLIAAFELGKRAARASLAKICLSSPQQVFNHLNPLLSPLPTECLFALTLDTKLQLIRMSEVTRGTINQTIANPRDILEQVILDRAHALIIAHNHPSGQPTPSEADHRFTRELRRLCQAMEVELIDHIIVGKTINGAKAYYSYREEGNT